MTNDPDKKEFVKICEMMEGSFPQASRLELATALAFSLYKALKDSPEAMERWIAGDKA